MSIVVPAFNEARGLPATLASIRSASAAFDARGWTHELIVCDNNSTDGTGNVARAAGARVVFEPGDAPWVRHPQVLVSSDGSGWEQVPAAASLADATLSLLRDPRHGRGEIRFDERTVRFIRLGSRVPLRSGTLEVGGSAR